VSFSMPGTRKKYRDLTYCLEDPTGELFLVKHQNLTTFCRKRGLTYQCIRDCYSGAQSHHKGWRVKNTLKRKHQRRPRQTPVSLLSPEGVIVEAANVHALCEQYALDPSTIYAVLKGRKQQHKGWRICPKTAQKLNPYQRQLLATAYPFCQRIARYHARGNDALYDDLLDEIIPKAIRAAQRYYLKEGASFNAYLFKWARGAVMNYFRRRGQELFLGEAVERIPNRDDV